MKVIFCDVDGPLIPGSMFFIDPEAAHKRKFSPIALAILKKLCIRSGAKVVMNSSHNYMDRFGFNLQQDMIRNGFPQEHFHNCWRTEFGSTYDGTRMSSIYKWIEYQCRGEEVDWICFDDSPFTLNVRLIVVKYDDGILIEHFEKALDILKIDNSGLIL